MTLSLALRKGLQDEDVPPLSQGQEVIGATCAWPAVDTRVQLPMVHCTALKGPVPTWHQATDKLQFLCPNSLHAVRIPGLQIWLCSSAPEGLGRVTETC